MDELDEIGTWYEDYPDKDKDLEELEKLKRTGLPPDETLQKMIDHAGFPKEVAYGWHYEANPISAWLDENGRVIKDPENYEISTKPGTEGMPIRKEK